MQQSLVNIQFYLFFQRTDQTSFPTLLCDLKTIVFRNILAAHLIKKGVLGGRNCSKRSNFTYTSWPACSTVDNWGSHLHDGAKSSQGGASRLVPVAVTDRLPPPTSSTNLPTSSESKSRHFEGESPVSTPLLGVQWSSSKQNEHLDQQDQGRGDCSWLHNPKIFEVIPLIVYPFSKSTQPWPTKHTFSVYFISKVLPKIWALPPTGNLLLRWELGGNTLLESENDFCFIIFQHAGETDTHQPHPIQLLTRCAQAHRPQNKHIHNESTLPIGNHFHAPSGESLLFAERLETSSGVRDGVGGELGGENIGFPSLMRCSFLWMFSFGVSATMRR